MQPELGELFLWADYVASPVSHVGKREHLKLWTLFTDYIYITCDKAASQMQSRNQTPVDKTNLHPITFHDLLVWGNCHNMMWLINSTPVFRHLALGINKTCT